MEMQDSRLQTSRSTYELILPEPANVTELEATFHFKHENISQASKSQPGMAEESAFFFIFLIKMIQHAAKLSHFSSLF
jgi:hypothetical protein